MEVTRKKHILLIFLLMFVVTAIKMNIVHAEDSVPEDRIAYLYNNAEAIIFDANGNEITNNFKKYVLENKFNNSELSDYVIENELSAVVPHQGEIPSTRANLIAMNGFTWTSSFQGVYTEVYVGAETYYDSSTRKVMSYTKPHARLVHGTSDMSAGIEHPNSTITVNNTLSPSRVIYVPRVYIKRNSGAYLYMKAKMRLTVLSIQGTSGQPSVENIGQW